MKEFKKFELKAFDSRGYRLTPIEFKEVIPFEVKRTYFIHDFIPGAQTGEHMHKIEEEVFVQVRGASVAIIDRGDGREYIAMREGDAIYVPKFVWHGFKDPSDDCVILAMSSTNYNPNRSDYVEDYEEFKRVSPFYWVKMKE